MALINIPESGLWATIAAALNSMFTEIFGFSGWGSYTDTQYTSASPLSLLADTDTVIPNNKGTVIETDKPSDISTFYDGTVITGRSGDDIIISVDFAVKPTNAGTDFIEVWFDITGGTGTPVVLSTLYRRIFSFPKGSGVERRISFSHSGYTLGTWEANGAVLYVKANNTAEIYDISYIIKRTHKAL